MDGDEIARDHPGRGRRAHGGQIGTQLAEAGDPQRQEIAVAVGGEFGVEHAGAALMVNSFVQLAAVDRGFNPERLLTARVDLNGVDSNGVRYITVEQRDGREVIALSPEVDVFYREVLERLRALPGVEAAEMASTGGDGRVTLLPGPGLPLDEQPWEGYRQVTPGYFRAMGIPLLKGRSFTESDTEGSSWVAIINETFARQYFPDDDPIGRFLQARLNRPGAVITPAAPARPRPCVGSSR